MTVGANIASGETPRCSLLLGTCRLCSLRDSCRCACSTRLLPPLYWLSRGWHLRLSSGICVCASPVPDAERRFSQNGGITTALRGDVSTVACQSMLIRLASLIRPDSTHLSLLKVRPQPLPRSSLAAPPFESSYERSLQRTRHEY